MTFQLVFPILTLLYAPSTFLQGVEVTLRSIRIILTVIRPELRDVAAALIVWWIITRYPLPSLPALCVFGLHLRLQGSSTTSRNTMDTVFAPFYGPRTPASVIAFADWVDGLRPEIDALVSEYGDLFESDTPCPTSDGGERKGLEEEVGHVLAPEKTVESLREIERRRELERTLAGVEEENARLMRRRDEMRERLAGLKALAKAKADAVLQRHADMAFLRTNFRLVQEALADKRKAQGGECTD